MDLVQYKGPFQSGQRITIAPEMGVTWVHIGIQVPKTQPLTVPQTRLTNNNKTTVETGLYRPSYERPVVLINNKTYQINEHGILEFDGLAEIEWTIEFLANLPAETIIDIIRR